MKRFLSRYNPRFIRSLVYMLQACEYNIADYLAWSGRVTNFARVEKRKMLRWTPKAMLLFISGWILVSMWLYIEYRAYLAVQARSDVPLVVGFLLIFLFPLALPYLMLFPLGAIQLLQWPVEAWIIAQARRKLAAHKAFKIAIAGSYSKTSIREIMKTVLSEGKRVAAPGGSENTPIGIARFVNRLKGDEEVLIFELGEYYPGDVKKLCQIVQPDLGIITGVNEAHLSKFKTVSAAMDTIFELADFLAQKFTRTSSGDMRVGPLYVNGESRHPKLPAHAIVFTREKVAPPTGGWKVVAAETSLDGTSFNLEKAGEQITVQSKLLGLHHIGPLVTAAHVALALHLTKAQIEQGLRNTRPFAHRMERRDDATGVITLDDSYNGNPDGVKAVIEFLAGIENHRRWYVTPGLVEMGDKSEEIHQRIGKQLAQAGIEKVVLIRDSVTPWIEKGLEENGFKGEVMWFDDALKCYDQLPYMTVAGDVVLLQNDWPDQYV